MCTTCDRSEILFRFSSFLSNFNLIKTETRKNEQKWLIKSMSQRHGQSPIPFNCFIVLKLFCRQLRMQNCFYETGNAFIVFGRSERYFQLKKKTVNKSTSASIIYCTRSLSFSSLSSVFFLHFTTAIRRSFIGFGSTLKVIKFVYQNPRQGISFV